MPYCKSWVPLESSPQVFNGLLYDLGASTALEFFDIYSLEPEAIEFLHRPIRALILVYPDPPDPKRGIKTPVASTGDEGVVWLKQTIDNACGLFAVLNALCNLPGFIDPSSLLHSLLGTMPAERDTFLTESEELERIYSLAAQKCVTSSPSPHEGVEHHYVCFVKTAKGDFYVLDGELDGPVKECTLERDEDILGGPGLEVIHKYLQEDGSFALLGLGERPNH